MAIPESEKRYVVVVSGPKANLPRNSRSTKITKTTAGPTQVGRRWDYLPEDLVGEIMVRLSSADRIRFAACCKKFWSTMPEFNNRDIDQLPWLVKPYLKSYNGDTDQLPSGYEFELFDPIHKTPYSYTLVHEVSGQFRPSKDAIKLIDSKNGWLLLSWEKQVGPCSIVASFLLVSPFTKQIVTLPDLDQSSTSMFAAFSAEPSSPDCVYFILHSYRDCTYGRVSTFRNGESEWKTVTLDRMHYLLLDGVVYHEGSFYCRAYTHVGCHLLAYDVNRNELRFSTGPKPSKEQEKCKWYSYVLVCEGRLLWVYLVVPCNDDKHKVRCLVYEYDQSDWVEKTHLGDQALFLCRRGSFSVSTSSDTANRIYYYRPGGDGRKQYYSLKDGKSYKCNEYSYLPDNEASRIWMEPPHLHATQQ